MDNGGAFTDRLFSALGSQHGRTALDIGCGTGDVTFRLAKAVGERGHVTGIDLNETALTTARERARDLGITNVTFRQTDVFDLQANTQFDLVTCRRVLMYLPDKARAVAAILQAMNSGGTLLLQEHAEHALSDTELLPLNSMANSLIWKTVRAEGADTDLGDKLYALLADAGARDIHLSAEALIQTPGQTSPTANMIDVMAERIVKSGVLTKAELAALNIPTLQERLSMELKAQKKSFIGEMIFGAVARKA